MAIMAKSTSSSKPLDQLLGHDEFINRHLGPSTDEIQAMLKTVGASSLTEFIASTVPADILLQEELDLAAPFSESQTLRQLQEFGEQNEVYKSYIGMGYYGTHVPQVIQRNVLENPGWYTAYTPYQAEISQGRLEALLNFQQMVMDLTAMEMANASLLDEATAAAEGMALCKRASKHKSNTFFVADDVHPQTLDVIQTRAKYFGFDVVVGPVATVSEQEVFGALFSYPGTTGNAQDLTEFVAQVHEQKGLVVVAVSYTHLTLPTIYSV